MYYSGCLVNVRTSTALYLGAFLMILGMFQRISMFFKGFWVFFKILVVFKVTCINQKHLEKPCTTTTSNILKLVWIKFIQLLLLFMYSEWRRKLLLLLLLLLLLIGCTTYTYSSNSPKPSIMQPIYEGKRKSFPIISKAEFICTDALNVE